MSDNIFVLHESSSEYETSSEDDEEERVNVVQQDLKFYEHTNYVDNIVKILPVVIKCEHIGSDVNSNMHDGINFSVTFDEPIIIHKICDVYLDNLVTYNCINNNADTNSICFLLDIKELDINTKSSEVNMINKIVIPNGSSLTGNNTATHRNKKMNFISTIHPKIINTLSGSLTNLNGDEIWHTSTDGVFTMELNFIFRN